MSDGEQHEVPQLSVIVLTYNHEQRLPAALGSIVSQALEGVACEILILDDCSTDGTAGAARRVAAGDGRMRVLAAPVNLGMQRNFRRGLEAARGSLVALLEGDDVWTDPHKLQRQIDHLAAHPEQVAVCHPTTVTLDGEPTGVEFESSISGLTVLTFADVTSAALPHFSSLMFRRAAFPTSPPWFDGLAAADWGMVALLALQGPIGVLPQTMSEYRKNPDSTWTPRPFLERRIASVSAMDALRANTSATGPEYDRELIGRHVEVAGFAARRREWGTVWRQLRSAGSLEWRATVIETVRLVWSRTRRA